MKKILPILIMLVPTLAVGSENTSFGGVLVFGDGSSKEVEHIIQAPGYIRNKKDALKVIIEKEYLEVPFSKLEEITLLSIGESKSYWEEGGLSSCSGNCRAIFVNIATTDGVEENALLGGSEDLNIKVTKLNRLTGESTELGFRFGDSEGEVKQIRLSDNKGAKRINKSTGKVWPSTFNYDPVSGAQLIWGE
jgi:hypothetical protein